jgi:hypothetical protein
MQNEQSVTIAFDPGTSGSKVLISYREEEYPFERVEKYFLINPSVRQLTEQTYKDLLDGASESVGPYSNLVSYIDPTSSDRVYFEVGETASKPGLLNVRDRKFEKLLAKVLAFLGYVVCGELQTNEWVGLNLGILLPFDEYNDRRMLMPWLRQILGGINECPSGGFEFNGVKIKNICLETIDCKPEGYGIYKAYQGERKNVEVAVLVVGHSDSSWLYFNNGTLVLNRSRTFPGTGMHDFIKTIKFTIIDELKAAEVLAKAGADLKPNILASLTQTKSAQEIEHLQQAIKQAKPQYWNDRRSEFRSLDLSELKSILTTGGTANFFAAELNLLFQELFKVRLNWCQTLMRKFMERFKVERKSDLHRFADGFGYYLTLPGVKQDEKKLIEVVGKKNG